MSGPWAAHNRGGVAVKKDLGPGLLTFVLFLTNASFPHWDA